MVVNDQTLNSYLAICVTLTSVTRLGDLLDFGQVFKAFGNTFLGNFCYGFKINHFSSEKIFGQLL